MNSPNRKEEYMANLEQYRAVLEDLIKQRNLLEFKIGEIDNAINALKRLMPADEVAVPKHAEPQPVLTGLPGKYTGMGVRWAILNLLAEDAVYPMGSTAIANALQQGGMTSTAKNFRGNVSAVLSDMNLKRGEVESAPGSRWKISQKGKEAWIHIKASRNRSSATVSEQLSVQ